MCVRACVCAYCLVALEVCYMVGLGSETFRPDTHTIEYSSFIFGFGLLISDILRPLGSIYFFYVFSVARAVGGGLPRYFK